MPYITCQACNFWVMPEKQAKSGGGEEVGQCRKYAPSPYQASESEKMKAHWPETDSDDGCGEGEIKEKMAKRGKAA